MSPPFFFARFLIDCCDLSWCSALFGFGQTPFGNKTACNFGVFFFLKKQVFGAKVLAIEIYTVY
jgi:hypothetical protein